MATEQNFTIRKGRTCTITVDVTGVSIWTDIVAKLFAYSDLEESSVLVTLDGTIDEGNNQISFTFTNDDTKDIDESSLYYDVTLYKDDLTYIKDANYGLIYIAPVAKTDPTV